MPKATKSSAQWATPELTHEETTTSSQDELRPRTWPRNHISTPRQPQPVPSMFMPYIEGPKMDWTVNEWLYHRFLKWCLKCENILECKLAALPESQQCKKVIAWLGDFGMDQYVSWGLLTDQLTLDTIWGRFEEFCKPQSKEVQARFDHLTSFRQGSHSVDEWYNAVQAQVNLAKYPPRNCQKIFTETFSGFSCEMRSLSPEPLVMEV